MIRTTPEGTILACGMIVIGWPSRFSMPCLVLLQAENTIFDGKGRVAAGDLLDAVLHRRGVVAQHVEARPVGDDLDIHVLVLVAIIFEQFCALLSARFITAGSF